jgi:NitT/TauT family transport system substrate-binding protein
MLMRALAATAVLALALPSGARSADLTTVHLGLVPSMSAAPLFIADQLGYFKQEGLDVQVTTFPSAANMIAPLGAGQLDVGGGAAVASMYNAIGRGIDVRVVADLMTDTPGYGCQRLLVRSDLVKNGRYKTVADLKGMTFAGNARGVGAESQLNKLLESGGLKFADVHHVYMGFPDSVAALKNSAIDATVVPEPNATVAVQSGAAVNVMGDDGYYPNQEVAVLVYGTTLLRTNRDAGMRFMRAFLRGVRYFNGALAKGKIAGANADTVIKILTDNTPVKEPGIYRALTACGSNPNGTINMASMKTDYDFYASDGLIDHAVDVNTAVDTTFVEDALKHIGPYKPGR